MNLVTEDGLRIAANFFRGRKKGTLILLAPGFAQYKDSNVLRDISSDLVAFGDVACLDFRGTGKSEGTYRFGAEEYKDLFPYMTWGKKKYKRVVIVGLSLGGYHAIRAAKEWPRLIDRLLLVSTPTCLEDVLKTGGPVLQAKNILSDWKSLKARLGLEFDIFFRWGNPFSKKPNAVDVARDVRTPMDVLAGGDDGLVLSKLTRMIFEGARGKKSWTVFEKGLHSELMYLQNPKKFIGWIKRCTHK